MKTLLFLVLVSASALAENWVAEADIPAANAQTPGVQGFLTQPLCQAARPGNTCYEFTGHSLRYEKIVGGVWVEDAALKAAFDAEQAELALRTDIGVAFSHSSGGGGLDCTTSPCIMDRNFPVPVKIESVSRTGVGLYTANFAPSAWVTAPLCAAAIDKGNGDFCVLTGIPTTTAASIMCFSGAGAPTDSQPIIVCGGK